MVGRECYQKVDSPQHEKHNPIQKYATLHISDEHEANDGIMQQENVTKSFTHPKKDCENVRRCTKKGNRIYCTQMNMGEQELKIAYAMLP